MAPWQPPSLNWRERDEWPEEEAPPSDQELEAHMDGSWAAPLARRSNQEAPEDWEYITNGT